MSLYHKYRPKKLDDVIGQDSAVQQLRTFLRKKELPHALLLSGPSGVGKTTIARILKRELGCSKSDFHEINAADTRGLDTVREIRERSSRKPFNSPCMIWLLDEAHHLTKREGGDAQTALLKMLEDTPNYIYYFLATTHPNGLRTTIRTRCTQINLSPIGQGELTDLIGSVLNGEGITIPQAVGDKIVESAKGSAREALQLLDKVIGLETEDEMLAAISPPESERQAWDLVKALLYEKATWTTITKLIQEIDLSDPERFRHYVLACAATEMKKGGKNMHRAFLVADNFGPNWYDNPETGLLAACYQIIHSS